MPDNLKMLLVIALAGAMFALLVYCGLQSARISKLTKQIAAVLSLARENATELTVIDGRLTHVMFDLGAKVEQLSASLPKIPKRDDKGRFIKP